VEGQLREVRSQLARTEELREVAAAEPPERASAVAKLQNDLEEKVALGVAREK
jgi:hypothetical protein